MTFGNNVRGRRAPPPLPMYEPVKLKHVPTMVRRRYDKFDASKLDDQNEGSPSKDGESEDDGSTEDYPSSDVYISDEDEPEDMGLGDFDSNQENKVGPVSQYDSNGDHSDTEHQMCNMDVFEDDSHHRLEIPDNDHGSEEGDGNTLQQTNPSSDVISGGSDECHRGGEGKSTDDCDTGTCSESVGNENIQPTDSVSEDNGPAVASNAPSMGFSLQDETRDNRLSDFSNTQERESEDYGAGDSKTSRDIKDEALNIGERSSFSDSQGSWQSENNGVQAEDPNIELDSGASDECQFRREGNSIHDLDKGTNCEDVVNGSVQPTENKKNEDDMPSVVTNDDPIVDFNLHDEIQEKRHTEISNLQGCAVGDSGDKDYGAGEVKTASDTGIKNEALDMTDDISANKEVSIQEDNMGGDRAEHTCPKFGSNASLNSEADKQDAHMPKQDTDHTMQNTSLKLQDLRREGDGAILDLNGTTDKETSVKAEVQGEAHRYSNDRKAFNPEAFRKTMEEDDYELCCPYCKHCITNTLIYQRRENGEHYRTTCFTGLFALFCCIRD